MKSNKSIDINNSQLKNLAAPTDPKDAATKAYVDVAVANGGTGGGGEGGTALTSYENQIAILPDYPASFATNSDDIQDATEVGRQIITADDPKTLLELENVDNTSDMNKPVSNATQAALDLKADINNPVFTGTVIGVTKSMVGLSNVDNTSDLDKPVSTATQLALDTKADYTVGLTVSVIKPGGGSWPANRPINDSQMVVLCIGEAPGPSWMTTNDVLLDLSNINNDIYLLPSDTLLPADDLLLKG